MDIVKKKNIPIYKSRKFILIVVFSLVALTLVLSFSARLTLFSVDKSTFITADVEFGTLIVKVSAPGVLAPRDIRWVSSVVDGKVERILVKPGALVEKGQVIVEMLNPELSRQADELRWELAEVKAEIRALNEQHATAVLDMEAQITANQMNFELEKMRLRAETELITKGNTTVSMIDFESRKLLVSNLEKTIEMDKARHRQLLSSIEAEKEAREARLNRIENTLQRAIFQEESLVVRAPEDAVLQALPLELGQQVSVGDNLARFAKKGDLIAELEVPEYLAARAQPGQKVLIDTRFSSVEGILTRIDPAVTDGTVQVDVELPAELPDEARPDLSVDGEIIIEEIRDTLFVRRPAFSQANQVMTVYKLDENNKYAEQVKIQFGVSSSLDIQVLSGLEKGDTIIVSESTGFETHERIALN